MALNWPSKDQNDILDYGINWGPFLGSDVIVSSTWTLSPSGLVDSMDTYSPQVATIWLSGGTLGQTYACVNQITTAAGRTVDQTVNINIANR